MEKFKKYLSKENIIIIILMIVATIISSMFIFDKILIRGVDTEYHLSRIIGIVNSWETSDFLAYIHLDTYGYGYAMGFFYSNLFMIVPCTLYMLGVDLFIAYKIFIFLCGIFTAITMYICVKSITKSKFTATIAMFLYTTSSYRIITMVAKAFVGELLSFIFIPVIILGLYKLIYEDEKKWWIFALGFIGILNSNLVMTEIMIAVSGIIILCNIKKIFKEKSRLKGFVKATILALLVTAMFWMPMVEQLINTKFEMSDLKDFYNPSKWTIGVKDLFWGTIHYKENIAAACGLGIIFIIIIAFRPKIKENNIITKVCDISIITGLILLFLMSDIFPWGKLGPIGGMLQFASRLEVVVVAVFSIACGIICNTFNKKITRRVVLLIIVIWQIIASIICLKSCEQTIIDLFQVQSKEVIRIRKEFIYNICDGVYLPKDSKYKEWRFNKNRNPEESEIKTNNEDLAYSYNKNNLTMEFNFEGNNMKDAYIEIPIHYYYGYIAKSLNDGSYYEIEQGEEGLIKINLGNKTEDKVIIKYEVTNTQKVSIVITILTLLSVCMARIIKKFGGINENRKNLKV